jgi:hypothetical protein
VWNSVRGKSAKDASAAGGTGSKSSLLRKLAGGEQFSQREFAGFLDAVRDAGIRLLPVDEFCTRYESYFEQDAPAAGRTDACFGHFKFDIHGDIARPVEMARILGKAGAQGLFLVMHRHALNDSWHGTEGMWNALAEIRDLGHEIGLHADPFHLITVHGDLYDGLDASLGELRDRGLAIRAMTLHGDSRPHIKARKLQANDFFRDEFRKSKWDGVAPEGQESLADHVHRYRHRKLYRKLGIEYIPDVNLVKQGDLITRAPMMYLSDNQRRLRIGNIESRIVKERSLQAEDLFRIRPEFAAAAAKVLARRPFLALFHPQWYR